MMNGGLLRVDFISNSLKVDIGRFLQMKEFILRLNFFRDWKYIKDEKFSLEVIVKVGLFYIGKQQYYYDYRFICLIYLYICI